METFGGLTGADTVDQAINYDYNYDCGFVSSLFLSFVVKIETN